MQKIRGWANAVSSRRCTPNDRCWFFFQALFYLWRNTNKTIHCRGARAPAHLLQLVFFRRHSPKSTQPAKERKREREKRKKEREGGKILGVSCLQFTSKSFFAFRFAVLYIFISSLFHWPHRLTLSFRNSCYKNCRIQL